MYNISLHRTSLLWFTSWIFFRSASGRRLNDWLWIGAYWLLADVALLKYYLLSVWLVMGRLLSTCWRKNWLFLLMVEVKVKLLSSAQFSSSLTTTSFRKDSTIILFAQYSLPLPYWHVDWIWSDHLLDSSFLFWQMVGYTNSMYSMWR